MAFMMVGFLHYAYTLVPVRLLNAATLRFAAGQGLILWTSTVATVSAPLPPAVGSCSASPPTQRMVTW